MVNNVPSNDNTLPPKYLALATVYLDTGDLALAGRAAGFSRASAEQRARQILAMPSVKAFVDSKQRSNAEAEQEEVLDTAGKVMARLEEVLDGNVADYFTIGADGQPILDLSKATRKQMAALKNIKVKERKLYDRNGSVIGIEKQSSLELLDKLRAAELMGRQAGLFKPDEQRVVLDVADRLLAARQRVLSSVAAERDGDLGLGSALLGDATTSDAGGG